ncbi:MAG: cyclopropane-fatty-acyl-phospholipid synthase [Coriobacteriia bacterium]|nr:cyclopropane-fatty-acyl-phospholipid synthase [Coriobacteriia bacterium]
MDVEGDLEAVFATFWPLIDSGEWRSIRGTARLLRLLRRLPVPPYRTGRERAASPAGRTHSIDRDEQAVRFHYDVSNDFYQLWLDSRMQYSCGYFEQPDVDLDTAQSAKLEHICRKLRLSPGDRLLDIGCGWGGLLEYAAEHYGVSGLGVTLSEPQAAEANERFERAGLADWTRAEVCDYRRLDGEFDAIVSVGMVEHVGRAQLREYCGQAFKLLRPGGVFLLHGITSKWEERPGPMDPFIARYVFPDGELTPISELLGHAESAGFEVRDVENLREHYAATLRHWVRNLEAHRDEAVALTDDITYRIWRLYMTGCAYNFERGGIGVCQSLLHKPTGGHSTLPPTRADWYADAGL